MCEGQGIASLKSLSFGDVWKVRDVLPFPQDGLSSLPGVGCRTGICNFYWVINSFENLM